MMCIKHRGYQGVLCPMLDVNYIYSNILSWNIIKKTSGHVGTRTCVAGLSQPTCYALHHHYIYINIYTTVPYISIYGTVVLITILDVLELI